MKPRETMAQWRGWLNSVYTQTVERAYFRLFGHPVHKRFVLIGNARTGSNYLLDGIRSSPAIRTYHEIFASHNRQPGKDFQKILSTVYGYESRATQMVGFKVFYNHLTEEEWQKLAALRDLKVIHLTRRNRLRTVISLEIAFKTGRWTEAGRQGASPEKKVKLDPARLVRRLEEIEAGEAATRARYADRPVLEIVYEELVRSPREVFAEVGEFLGVNGIDPEQIRIRRQNPEPLAELIENYSEVRAALESTRFAGYLVQ